MHFAIDAGHNSPPGDTGATGYAVEDKLTRQLADTAINLLVAAGHKVTDCKFPQSSDLMESLVGRVEIANSSKADRYVSLHFNKFLEKTQITPNPMGVEIYAVSSRGRTIASPVLAEIVKLGFKDRGIKDEGFYVLVHTDMPAILIESFFLDSTADFRLFERVGMDALAKAIVKGLIA